jgi:hypothetical protein
VRYFVGQDTLINFWKQIRTAARDITDTLDFEDYLLSQLQDIKYVARENTASKIRSLFGHF